MMARMIILLLWSVLVLGCASAPRDTPRSSDPTEVIRSLTSNPIEARGLARLAQEHPDLFKTRDDFEIALAAQRAGRVRRQAVAIELRQQYPNVTEEEMQVLVKDRLLREGPPGGLSQAPAMAPIAPMPMINCTSMDFGLGMTTTSCY